MRRLHIAFALVAAATFSPNGPATAEPNELEAELGRAEVRIWSAPFELASGRTVRELALPQRLARRDYRRVHERPDEPGEYFWGHERFWIYRRAHRVGGTELPAALAGLALEPESGRIEAAMTPAETHVPFDGGDREGLWLEPLLLSEELGHRRAVRHRVELSELPVQVWRAVLAAEDHRFFEHSGIDPRAVARAALANVRAGEVVEGGSTITQQLVKNRELTAARTVGRKMSEAVRALALEAQYDKRDILEAYLNEVYLGHVDGLAVHGIGTAARIYFGRPASEMSLAQAATLAALIQGPNRLDPGRRPGAARERRDWVQSRMEELGWVSPEERRRAASHPVRSPPGEPRRPPAPRFLDWVAELARRAAPGRIERQRGVVIETSLDPFLQARAEEVAGRELASLERRSRRVPSGALEVALVAIDAASGDVLAHVGGDPRDNGVFDRVRRAERQPGSIVKPLLLLEAFETCGERQPLHPATRVADEPLRIELDSGPWEPLNPDGEFVGTLMARRALVESRNVPFVRLARWCGWHASAERLRRLGLNLPADPPASFVLGAVETSPLAIATAYTVFPELGQVRSPRPVRRIERPAGRAIEVIEPRGRGVVEPATAYLVDDMLRDSVRHGTARAAALETVGGVEARAKTGTSSGERDAWLAGHASGIVTVVWVGRDDGRPLGYSAAEAAAPIWRRFMQEAVRTRLPREPVRPEAVVELWFDSGTGLLVRERNPRAVREIFRRGATPRRDRFWRSDDPVPVVR